MIVGLGSTPLVTTLRAFQRVRTWNRHHTSCASNFGRARRGTAIEELVTLGRDLEPAASDAVG
jgi:hypothetical protein